MADPKYGEPGYTDPRVAEIKKQVAEARKPAKKAAKPKPKAKKSSGAK